MKSVGVVYQFAELFKLAGIAREWDIEFQITTFGIFLVKVLQCTLPLGFAVQIGIM